MSNFLHESDHMLGKLISDKGILARFPDGSDYLDELNAVFDATLEDCTYIYEDHRLLIENSMHLQLRFNSNGIQWWELHKEKCTEPTESDFGKPVVYTFPYAADIVSVLEGFNDYQRTNPDELMFRFPLDKSCECLP